MPAAVPVPPDPATVVVAVSFLNDTLVAVADSTSSMPASSSAYTCRLSRTSIDDKSEKYCEVESLNAALRSATVFPVVASVDFALVKA